MKALTILLALLVVVLSVMPCCLEEACAADDVLTEQTTDSHDSDAEACSPFYSCASCIGFTVADLTVERSVPETPRAKPFEAFRQHYLPPFHHAIWQPPKIS